MSGKLRDFAFGAFGLAVCGGALYLLYAAHFEIARLIGGAIAWMAMMVLLMIAIFVGVKIWEYLSKGRP